MYFSMGLRGKSALWASIIKWDFKKNLQWLTRKTHHFIKKHRYLCTSSDKMVRENFEIASKKGDTLTYCVTCTADISIGNRAID